MCQNVLLKLRKYGFVPALLSPLYPDDPSSPGHVLHFPPDIPQQSERARGVEPELRER